MDAKNPYASPPRPVKSTDEARQGVTGQHVRTVLIVGTLAVIGLFVIIWLSYFGR